MNGGIFLIQNDGRLSEMKEQPYKSEGLLQELLAKYPNLLAGDQMDNAAPRRWLLISREMGLASEEDGGDRWSIDHLFLDQDAIPTIIEVKRSSDSRIRREVVGQMLDYAANAVVYWPIESIRAEFEKTCNERGTDADEILSEFLGEGFDPIAFWQQAKTNLQAGKIRLVFVADEIPDELRRIVEFLNDQMDRAEVLAVEIRQFVGEGMKTLVPRVIGLTAEAQRKKSIAGQGRKWDEASFFRELETLRGQEIAAVAKRIVDWARSQGELYWTNEAGSFVPGIRINDEEFYPFALKKRGKVMIYFARWRKRANLVKDAHKRELLKRLNAIRGISLPDDTVDGLPKIDLAELRDGEVLKQFLSTFDWFIKELQSP